MISIKSIQLYFFSVLKIISLRLKHVYFKTSYYNRSLIKNKPERFFYIPSFYLIVPLAENNEHLDNTIENFSENLWNKKLNNQFDSDNLNSFLWLAKLDRKSSRLVSQKIINGWINKYFDYDPASWKKDILANRIISWISNMDITFEKCKKDYKHKFILSIFKQSNYLIKNINSLNFDINKIICCASIILIGLSFKENSSLEIGIKELEKTIKIYFDKDGFPKTRNPEELFISLKYLILIKEWIKEAQEKVPDFLDEIIYKCGSCYNFLNNSNKNFPLFNGSSEINYGDYNNFLKNHKYKFINKKNELGGYYKIKKNKLEIFFDAGNPPSNNFIKNYQSGCLSFEMISNGKKIICNSGYSKYISTKMSSLSCSTALHSSLYLNERSINIFYKNKYINEIFGNCLVNEHKVINKNYEEDELAYTVSATHNGYEKINYFIHTRTIKILKNENKIIGCDQLSRIKNYTNLVDYSIRFHVYPGIKIAKTSNEKTVLISLNNGEGWQIINDTENFEVENSIFLGRNSKIIKNECISISGKSGKNNININWVIEKIS